MPKSVIPGRFAVDEHSFATNAVPDPFDGRDLEYRPKLDPLPDFIEPPAAEFRHVLYQEGESCTGHALATVINAGLAKRAGPGDKAPERVSPYMLYYFARRYDAFPGEADTGSSLRAALKGWFYHGVCTEKRWPCLCDPHESKQGTSKAVAGPDIHDPEFVRDCKERPLGAFYRVNCFRLDDMQSAISELHAVLASAQIHTGWRRPTPYTKGQASFHVIPRPEAPLQVGGHAFAIVGYNEIGFLIQNSWGEQWGDGGFAVLTYEDWLDSAYDAWVVRHGVRNTPFLKGRRKDEQATHSMLATGVGPSHRRLDRHLLSLASDGALSSTGEFVSTPQQLTRITSRMEEWHDAWIKEGAQKRHIVIYAQNGMLPEPDSLEAAERPLNWWINNRIYPIYLAWDSGPAELLLEEFGQRMSQPNPKGGVGFDQVEQFDRLVELTARRHRQWMWERLKQHARAAGGKTGSRRRPGGVIQLATMLRTYVRRHRTQCSVHLAGHSAGALVLAELLPRLLELHLPVASLSLLAPAMRVDEFDHMLQLLPHHAVDRFTLFGLSDIREQNDTCRGAEFPFYQKSLLYLIARGLEARQPGTAQAAEVPVLGMAKYYQDEKLKSRIERRFADAVFVTAPDTGDPAKSADAEHHGDFENDALTMTSIATRLLPTEPVDPYRAHAELLGLKQPPKPDASTEERIAIVDTQPPQSPPVQTGRAASRTTPIVPPCSDAALPPELDEVPGEDRTSTSLDLGEWKASANSRPTRRTRRRTHA